MSVRITLGNKLSQNETLLFEANTKINELNHQIVQNKLEFDKLLEEKILIKDLNNKLKENLQNLENKNSNFKRQLEDKQNFIIELQNKNSELENANKEIQNSNKILQKEIEKLNTIINCNKNNNQKFFEELEETEKIKNSFENSMIELNEINQKLTEKVKIYEDVLKQKERYINVLMNRKEQKFKQISVSNNTQTNFKNKNLITQKIDDESNSSNTSILLQNKIKELEEKLQMKDIQLKKIESEKCNLMTRIRNTNNK